MHTEGPVFIYLNPKSKICSTSISTQSSICSVGTAVSLGRLVGRPTAGTRPFCRANFGPRVSESGRGRTAVDIAEIQDFTGRSCRPKTWALVGCGRPLDQILGRLVGRPNGRGRWGAGPGAAVPSTKYWGVWSVDQTVERTGAFGRVRPSSRPNPGAFGRST